MKIITWNVNGLRAVLSKGAWQWVESQAPDVVCLQEIKARPEQLSAEQLGAFSTWQPIWNPAQRPGYSGVASILRAPYSAQPPAESRLGLGRPEFDTEGRVICTRHSGFLLFNIYFPNGQRGQDRVDFKLDFYTHLLDLCDALHAAGEHIVLTGDFNTAHRPIDLKNPKSNETTSGFLPEERAMIDRYLEHGFVDIWRRLYPERVQYTWWTYIGNARSRNVGWRLDYYLVSLGLVDRIRDVVIHDDVMGSDHCPVSLLIE